MAVQKYPGRVLSKTPPTITPPVDGEGGSAPGVWTLSEALENEKAGTWPKPTLPRELYTWGDGTQGILGQSDTNINYSSPTQVGALVNWLQASVGNQFAGAVKLDNTLWTWGRPSGGRLGHNNGTYLSSPVQVGSLTNWSQLGTGGGNCAAIKTDGTLWTWGNGYRGAIGNNLQNDVSSPIQVGALSNWAKVSLTPNNYTVAAIQTNGTLWTWGGTSYSYGELGHNDRIARSSPTQVGSLTTWYQVSMGSGFCGAVKTDGTLWMWGNGNTGKLGLNLSSGNRSSPVQVGALTNWSQVQTCSGFTAAVKTDGTLWVWGSSGNGRTGTNNLITYSSPVQVGALTDWAQVTTTNAGAAAIKTDGTLWAWGFNNNGQVGDGTTVNRSSPVQIGAATNWSSASGNLGGTLAAITKG